MDVFFNIISMIFVELSSQAVVSHVLPKAKKREIEQEEKARQNKTIKTDKKILIFFNIGVMLMNVIAIIIFAFPNFIKNTLSFNYTATILIWWIPLIFDTIVIYKLNTEVHYNENEIIVKKLFRKPKIYKFSEIISFTEKGNLKVVTTKGKLYYSMA